MSDQDALRVLMCGSRTLRFSDFFPVVAVIERYTRIGPIVVIHGAAPGADSLAGRCAEALGLTVEAYPADWAKHGKRAGYLRNKQMLDEGKPDVVWAFVDKPLVESKGTAMMVDLARGAGVPVYVVEHIPSIEGQP